LKNSNEQSLKEVINELLKTYKLEKGITESKVINSWEKVAGSIIYKHTEKIYVRNNKLYVKLDAPSLKHELSFAKSKLIKKINKTIGQDFIEEMFFL
jgi:predicted nucleic acid-binding Zn ribbon protein